MDERTATRAGLLLAGTAAAVGGGLAGYAWWASRKAEELVPPAGRFVDVDGARLHYVDRGTGPAIVLIHGVAAQLRNFTYGLVDLLAHDHRVIAIDRPGCGYSTVEGSQPTLEAQAPIIAAALAKLGVENAIIVGHSMGGAVALALAQQFPRLVRALALVAPLTQPVETVPPVFRDIVIESDLQRRLIAWTLAVPMAQARGSAILDQVFAPEPVPGDFATAGGGALGLRPESFVTSSTELVNSPASMRAIADRHRSLDLPVAILFGREDRLLDPGLHGHHTAKAIPGATIEIVDGGHMLPVTQPGTVDRWLRAFERDLPEIAPASTAA